jgi:hypothetical protein
MMSGVPKLTTMPAKDGFVFQPRDAVIIWFIYQLGIADVELIAAYIQGGYHTTYKRVAKLEAQHYLSRITKPPEKAIWQLGPKAAAVLIEHGWAPETIASQRLRANELKPLGIRHSLFVSSIHAKLLNETKNRPEKIALWRQDRGVWDRATWTADDGNETVLPVRPDAYFVIEHTGRPEGRNKLHFYLEADRATMASERIAAKIKAYRSYHDGRRFEKKYPGMTSFQVLMVTETRRRAESLQAGLDYLLPTANLKRAYRFLPFEDLSLDTLLPKTGNSLTISAGSVRFPQTLEAEHGTK